MLLRSIALIGCCAASFTIIAEEKTSDYYLGASTGIIKFESSTKDPVNASLNLGYNFSNTWALEGQYSKSIRDGEIDRNKVNIINGNYDYDLESIAAYGVYRSSGKMYVKAKAGLVYNDIGGYSSTELGFGAGVGFRITDNTATNIELEATVIDQKTTYYSIGVNFGF